MNRDKREPEYPAELESQFILRLPEEPAKVLRELLKSGENIKNRLMIQIDNDMRNGEVRFDHWLMHAKIVDLPAIIESLKTIDNKSFYKTADISQMMICKEEADQTPSEEESPSKNKKKDPYKVDKKFLWPHGVTPPTKNVRKRRFRKTLKKKYVEAPEIEKEVKRLLRADNEAVSVTWEIVNEEDDQIKPEPSTPAPAPKAEKKSKGAKKRAAAAKAKAKSTASATAASATAAATATAITTATATTTTTATATAVAAAAAAAAATTSAAKGAATATASAATASTATASAATASAAAAAVAGSTRTNNSESSNVVDIFGSAVSDSDAEEDNINVELDDSHFSTYDSRLSDNNSALGLGDMHLQKESYPIEFDSQMFQSGHTSKKFNRSRATSTVTKIGGLSSEEDGEYSRDKDNMSGRIEELRTELEELKQRRQRMQYEIAGMENLALRQRFQDTLHTLNQDVMYKEMEYQGLITLQNSEDI